MKKELINLPDEQIGYLFSQTYLLKQKIFNSALKELNITYIQFVILATAFVLQDEQGWITQQTIASQRRLDKVTVSNTVKTLVQKGLIRRSHHPTDHRAFIIKLTLRGREVAARGKEIAQTTDETFFSNIDSDNLRTILKKLLSENSKFFRNTES